MLISIYYGKYITLEGNVRFAPPLFGFDINYIFFKEYLWQFTFEHTGGGRANADPHERYWLAMSLGPSSFGEVPFNLLSSLYNFLMFYFPIYALN